MSHIYSAEQKQTQSSQIFSPKKNRVLQQMVRAQQSPDHGVMVGKHEEAEDNETD